MHKTIHIISFDIPYPANYGGIIDVFYKIKILHQQGVQIILHCFQYGDRTATSVLEKYCAAVYYYPRKIGLRGLYLQLPYIVSSRIDSNLLNNLIANEAPILFEGTHTTFLASHPLLKNRKKILRAHNVETHYYAELAKNTSWGIKKIYYLLEANRLKKYEQQLNYFQHVMAVSMKDIHYLTPWFPAAQKHYIPSFHPFQKVSAQLGNGTYCLYHGNLSVAENQKAVDYLVKYIFNELNIPLVIAGKSPPAEMMAYENNHIKIIANPSDQQMLTLIQDAHIHVLPFFQDTGLKLKLLAALFAGRFCIMNDCYIEDILNKTIVQAKNTNDFKQQILSIMQLPFTQEALDIRKMALTDYAVSVQAEKLYNLL